MICNKEGSAWVSLLTQHCISHYISLYSDLSERIKAATKEIHVRAENTKLMLAFQKGNVSLQQYKVSHRPGPY